MGEPHHNPILSWYLLGFLSSSQPTINLSVWSENNAISKGKGWSRNLLFYSRYTKFKKYCYSAISAGMRPCNNKARCLHFHICSNSEMGQYLRRSATVKGYLKKNRAMQNQNLLADLAKSQVILKQYKLVYELRWEGNNTMKKHLSSGTQLL